MWEGPTYKNSRYLWVSWRSLHKMCVSCNDYCNVIAAMLR